MQPHRLRVPLMTTATAVSSRGALLWVGGGGRLLLKTGTGLVRGRVRRRQAWTRRDGQFLINRGLGHRMAERLTSRGGQRHADKERAQTSHNDTILGTGEVVNTTQSSLEPDARLHVPSPREAMKRNAKRESAAGSPSFQKRERRDELRTDSEAWRVFLAEFRAWHEKVPRLTRRDADRRSSDRIAGSDDAARVEGDGYVGRAARLDDDRGGDG